MAVEHPVAISPAPITRRIAAIAFDSAICFVTVWILPGIVSSQSATFVGFLLAVIYFVARDSFSGGRGVGKRLMRLRVLSVGTLSPAGIRESVRRNGLFLSYCLLAAILNTVVSIFLPSLPLSSMYLGLLVAVFCAFRYVEPQKHRTKMDAFAGTVVVLHR